MRPFYSRAGALGLLLFVGGACVSSCAAIVGVDNDYKNAADELCQCKPYSEISDCAERVTRRLKEEPDKAARWIADFDKDCVCKDSQRCAKSPPVCMTCGEFVEAPNDLVALCGPSEPVAGALLLCLCARCNSPCITPTATHWLCGGSDILSACDECMENRVEDQSCALEAAACLADRPRD